MTFDHIRTEQIMEKFCKMFNLLEVVYACMIHICLINGI